MSFPFDESRTLRLGGLREEHYYVNTTFWYGEYVFIVRSIELHRQLKTSVPLCLKHYYKQVKEKSLQKTSRSP